ncbi:MAG: hypothetical protein KDA45_05135 [Planctomycetales bacterium]|nr:hypothetical protein [Planctomycetales bacterium]
MGLTFFLCLGAARLVYSQDQASPSDVLPSVAKGLQAVPPPVTAPLPPGDAAVADAPAGEAANANAAGEATATGDATAATPLPLPQASAADPSSRQLQHIMLQALNRLDAQQMPKLDETRSDLRAAIADLEQYLDLSSDRGQAWSRFLKLEAIKQELDKPQPDWSTLVDLHMNMRQNYLGLEYAPYLRVRQGIIDVVRALRFGSNPEKMVRDLQGGMKALVNRLNEPVEGADTVRSYDVGLIANYLNETGQVPWAVEQIHQQFSAPNVQVFAREQFLNRLVMRPVSEPAAVNECLLGTRLVGQAMLSGGLSLDVLPMVGGVSLTLNMSATMNSSNRGYNRGVVLHTTGNSPIYAAKQVFITPNGISSAPAQVATNLQTQINAIEHRLRLVRRIASKKAAQQKPLADSIAEGRLQNRIRSKYEQQVGEQLSEANVQLASFRSQPRPVLPRLGLSRPQIQISSTHDSVQGSVVQAAAHQLSAARPCDFAVPPAAQVVFAAHQSAVTNALDIVVGDRTIRSADLDDYAQQALGEVPEEVRQEASGEAWSVTMASYRPVELEFDEHDIKVKLRIARMSRGDQSLNDPAIVTAVYHPSYRDGVITLDRKGDVNVTFARESRGLRAVTLSSFFRVKFNTIFKEQVVTERIDLKQTLPRAPKLEVLSLRIQDGWLQVGLR